MTSAIIAKICLTALLSPNVACHEALALAELESSLNPKAVGGLGERGLWQVRPEYYPKKTYTGSLTQQVKYGILALGAVKSRCYKDLTTNWVMCWNVGVSKGKRLKGTKKGPYRLHYIKLADKWRKWEHANKAYLRLRLLQSQFSTETLLTQQSMLSAY